MVTFFFLCSQTVRICIEGSGCDANEGMTSPPKLDKWAKPRQSLGKPFLAGITFGGFNNVEISCLVCAESATSGTFDRSTVIFGLGNLTNFALSKMF